MVYPRRSRSKDDGIDDDGGPTTTAKSGGKSIFDRPELRGSLNRRSPSPAEERIIRVDSRKKIASTDRPTYSSASRSSSISGGSFGGLKDRLRKISVESLVRKPTTSSRDLDEDDNRGNNLSRNDGLRGNYAFMIDCFSYCLKIRCSCGLGSVCGWM